MGKYSNGEIIFRSKYCPLSMSDIQGSLSIHLSREEKEKNDEFIREIANTTEAIADNFEERMVAEKETSAEHYSCGCD